MNTITKAQRKAVCDVARTMILAARLAKQSDTPRAERARWKDRCGAAIRTLASVKPEYDTLREYAAHVSLRAQKYIVRHCPPAFAFECGCTIDALEAY